MISSLVAFFGSWSRPPILTENIAAGSPCRGALTTASTSNSSFESIFESIFDGRSGDRDRVEDSESDIFVCFFI